MACESYAKTYFSLETSEETSLFIWTINHILYNGII